MSGKGVPRGWRTRAMAGWRTLGVLVVVLAAAGCGVDAKRQSSMEEHLRATAAGRGPRDLVVVYSDMHGLWGGVTIAVSADGSFERAERQRGAAEATVVRRSITQAQVAELARLLLEIEAWDQRTPDRLPVPDESRATLTVTAGDLKTSIWEWHGDLKRNGRIDRVREFLQALGRAPGA